MSQASQATTPATQEHPHAVETEVLARLEQVRQELESRFRDAGATLADVLGMIERLDESLTELAAAMDSDVVEGTTGELLRAVSRLSSLPQSQLQRAARLTDVQAATSTLMAHIDGMRQTMGYIRVFAINIKITAAGSAEFTGYAGEMLERIDYGSGELDTFAEAVESLARQVGAAAAAEQDLERQSASVLPKVMRDLTADAEALKEHHRKIANATREVAAIARDVRGKVAPTLAALQIGDITRQRVEHVQQALEMARELAADEPESVALRNAVHRLLSAHLDDLLRQFREETRRVATNLAEMADETNRMLRLRDGAYGGSARSRGGFVGALEASVTIADDLVRRVGTANADAATIAAATSKAAGSLVPRVTGVRAVKTEIQHMSVNTSLRSSRMGPSGRALTVIASELRSEATALDQVATRTTEIIGQLADRAATLGEGETATEGCEGLGTAMERIRALGDDIEWRLPRVAQQGRDVSEAIARCTSLLNFHEGLTANLESASVALRSMAAKPPLEPSSEVDPALFERIASLYTMAREREIHRLHAPGSAAVASEPTPAAAATDEDDLDALLF